MSQLSNKQEFICNECYNPILMKEKSIANISYYYCGNCNSNYVNVNNKVNYDYIYKEVLLRAINALNDMLDITLTKSSNIITVMVNSVTIANVSFLRDVSEEMLDVVKIE